MSLKSKWENLQLHSKNIKQGGQRSGLDTLFEYFDFESASFEDSVEWLERLTQWLRYAGGEEQHPHTRVKFLMLILENNIEWKTNSSMLIQRVLLGAFYFRLFTDTGVPSGNAFSKELMIRLVNVLFPNRGKVHSMRTVLSTVFSQADDCDWIRTLPESLWGFLLDWVLLYKDFNFLKKFQTQIKKDLQQAIQVLSVRCVSIAYREELMDRAAEDIEDVRSFLNLVHLLEKYLNEKVPEEKVFLLSEIQKTIETAKKYLKTVYQHLEAFGVSLELVFQLDRASLFLTRIETLLKIEESITTIQKENIRNVVWSFFVHLVEGNRHDSRVQYWVRGNLKLLSQKIVEHNGKIGEDAITRDSKGYFRVFWGGCGGGALTALTAIVKLHTPSHIPPFIDALFSTVNFSLSFILMHYLHFKLATKQPSVMASALAQKIKESPVKEMEQSFVREVACISRTQFAAVAGNILMVIPVALGVHFFILYLWGTPSISMAKSEYFIKSIHPLTTLTVFYAAWTGVLLWVSALFSGWLENAYVFYKIPEALKAQKMLKTIFGAPKLNAIVEHISEHLIGVSSSICLGTLLAFSPQISNFFGFPLDVRHITITTGGLTFAIANLGLNSVSLSQWISSAFGVISIGLMNFGVSFWLALMIAIRARDLPKQRISELFRSVFLRIRKSPLEFLFPVHKNGSN